jgi:hypothetical protein
MCASVSCPRQQQPTIKQDNISNVAETCTEVSRVLKSGGVFLVITYGKPNTRVRERNVTRGKSFSDGMFYTNSVQVDVESNNNIWGKWRQQALCLLDGEKLVAAVATRQGVWYQINLSWNPSCHFLVLSKP